MTSNFVNFTLWLVEQLPISKVQFDDDTQKVSFHQNSANGIYSSRLDAVSPDDNIEKITSSTTPSNAGQITGVSSQLPLVNVSSACNKEGVLMDASTNAPKKYISIRQTGNSDFQIVDITNVSQENKESGINAAYRNKVTQRSEEPVSNEIPNDKITSFQTARLDNELEHMSTGQDKRKPSALTEGNVHNNSFSSSSASESAIMGNEHLSVRGNERNDQLNQSVDLMNLSVMDNSNSSSPYQAYGVINRTRNARAKLGPTLPAENGVDFNTEVDIRFKRDKLILKTIHTELTKLVQMNDKLTFAEDSVDRLKIAIRQVQDQTQHDTDTLDTSGHLPDAPNLSMSAKEAEEHIACAKEQLERLKVANDDASKVIEKNKGSIEDIDKKVKAGKATLKHLEYDVNVIEKESRKLNKELEKVLKIEIGADKDNLNCNSE